MLASVWGKEADLVETFLEECSQMMKGIRRAVSDHDAEGLQQCAHTLKSSAKILGDDPLTEAAFQMERYGRGSDLAGAQTGLSQLEQEVTRFQAALEAALSAARVRAEDDQHTSPPDGKDETMPR